MKARSAKNKGYRMERFVLDYLRDNLDANAYTPVGSGNGLEKGDVYLPKQGIVIEVKNQDKTGMSKFLKFWAQTEDQAHNQTPMLVLRHPEYAEGRKTLAVMFFEDVVDLLTKEAGEVTVNESDADYATRNAITQLESGIKALKKKYRL